MMGSTFKLSIAVGPMLKLLLVWWNMPSTKLIAK